VLVSLVVVYRGESAIHSMSDQERSMATPESTGTANSSLKRNLLDVARYYLGIPWGILAVGILVLTIGAAFNWSWLVAAGIAPLLLSLAACAIMCAVGVCCMNMKEESVSGQFQHHRRWK
jgi:hypothetical protein